MKSFMGVFFLAAFLSLLATGCVTTSSPSAARQARAAQIHGDWAAAVPLWSQAIEEQKGIWKEQFATAPSRFAVLYYELGRSEGAICQWDAAARDLNHTLEIDEKNRGPVWMDLTELARMYHAQGNDGEAEVYFDRLLKDMPKDLIEGNDPQGTVALLDEAAQTKAALGKKDESAELRAHADKVRAKHPNLSPPPDWTPYGLHCK